MKNKKWIKWLVYSAIVYVILIPLKMWVIGISIALLIGFLFGILNGILDELKQIKKRSGGIHRF